MKKITKIATRWSAIAMSVVGLAACDSSVTDPFVIDKVDKALRELLDFD